MDTLPNTKKHLQLEVEGAFWYSYEQAFADERTLDETELPG